MILEPTKPAVDTNKLIQILGGRSADSLTNSVGKTLESFTSRITDFLRPRIIYRMLGIASCNGSVQLEGGLSFNSIKASRVFCDCTDICCFLATIGRGIDEEIIRLTERKRSSDAYILDAVGSAAVETIVEQFHDRIKTRLLAEDKTVTLRLSPGYCDWPLQEQKKLFRLLDAGKIGVDLSESSLMQPRKTISGIFGVMPLSVGCRTPAYNPCSDCRKKNCTARRADCRHTDTQPATAAGYMEIT